MTENINYRIEKDTMGEVQVPADAYWGAQTQRSLQNFKIGEQKMPREIILGFAYLKKAAKADFEGICSGDITVMRAKEELLLPELLPFIVSNEMFFDYAVTHSAGGLSPRVKFTPPLSVEILLSNSSLIFALSLW